MRDEDCVAFLQWGLPRLRLRWEGFRKVRGQVCKRIGRRIQALGLSDLSAYKDYLEHHAAEWDVLDSLCRVTLSRFYRDRKVFDTLRCELLPCLARQAIAQGGSAVRCWSAGSCSGEEPYTLQILWKRCIVPQLPAPLPLSIVATEVDAALIERARRRCYPKSSLKDLPEELMQHVFECTEGGYAIRAPFVEHIRFVQQDIREQVPAGSFHLILCRNLVFTYFEEDVQRSLLEDLGERLLPEGILVIGSHESLPARIETLISYDESLGIYRKAISHPNSSNNPMR